MRIRALLAVSFLLAVSVGVSVARAADNPYLDQANNIPCPAAPPGWTLPAASAGGRVVLTPLTVEDSADNLNETSGAPFVEIDCEYLTAGGTKVIQLAVRYALPVDINPWNDFYIGCTGLHRQQPGATAAEAWNDTDRTYRVVGVNTWSLATFVDDLKALQPSDVPRFESMARTMLAGAQPYAHNCKLAGGGAATGVQSIWTFSFAAQTTAGGITSSGSDSGTFVTSDTASGGTSGTITNLVANDFRVRVKAKGTSESLQVHVVSPLAFTHGYGSQLKARVVVLGSNVSSCGKGAQGTLQLSVQLLTPPSVALQLCGRTYLNGKGTVHAVMKVA